MVLDGYVALLVGDGDGLASTVGTQLRSILTLDGSDARGEFTRIGYPNVIADDVRALIQTIDEHVGLTVLGLLIEPGVILVAVARELIHRLKAGCAFVGHGHKVHVLVGLDDDTHLNLIAHLERSGAVQ